MYSCEECLAEQCGVACECFCHMPDDDELAKYELWREQVVGW